MDRDSAVGKATRYGLDGSGIEIRWGRDFPRRSRMALRPTHSPRNEYKVIPEGKAPGRSVDTHPSSAKVKENVELFFYSLCGPSWPLLGRTSLSSALSYFVSNLKSEIITSLVCRYLNSILLWIYASRRLIYICKHREALIYNEKVQLWFGGDYSGS